MKVILLGYMGSGKSSVGKSLALKLNFPFKDLDSEIERAEGKAIAEIFSQKGEIYFRKKENSILKNLLSEKRNLVLATGGGTPCYGDAMDVMVGNEDVITIYLKNSIATLADRLGSETEKRPLISHLTSKEALSEFIGKHLFERAYYYNQASMVLETDGLSIEEVVQKIVQKLF